MLSAVIAIHIVASIVLIASVLLQVGKGASIGSTFGGASSQTLFGSAGPATFLTKITAACALIFMVTSLYLTFTGSKARTSSIMTGVPAVTAPVQEPAPAPGEMDTEKTAEPVKAAPEKAEKPAPGAGAEQEKGAPVKKK
jgi:preprotein translocase subunit SecG